MKKVVIIGGVAGGAGTATRLRRLDEQANIIMFEKDKYISFANCGLPYYISGVIEDREDLIIQTPERLEERANIDVRNFSRVTKVDTENKLVYVSSKDKGDYTEDYDYLVIATGVNPINLNLADDVKEHFFTLRNIPDVDKIKEQVDKGVKSAAVIGGGFIGLEVGENLKEAGIDTYLVEAAPHVMPPLDYEMAKILENELERNDINLFTDTRMEDAKMVDGKVELVLSDGNKLQVDMVVSAVGVRPATDFLKDSGITLNERGYIKTNTYMETNIPNVYAVGDAVEIENFVTKQPDSIALASPANKQARIVAGNIAGEKGEYRGTQGTSVMKAFNLTVASTGINERTAKNLGLPYHSVSIHPINHAGYYPGATKLSMKMIFNTENGKILGAQAVGEQGVDKRIDVMSTAMRLGATIDDLTELELAYAPPYSLVRDPVNMLGFIAQNVMEGLGDEIEIDYILERDKDTTMLIDICSPEEYAAGTINGAINIPLDELRDRLDELDKSKEIIQVCQSGSRSYTAQRILSQNGFNAKYLKGGLETYRNSTNNK